MDSSKKEQWHFGIDAGGTFTDVMSISDQGKIEVCKVPSTPAAPVQGPINGIKAMSPHLAGGSIASISHGTTVGLNALLQGNFPAVGLIVTRGFRHVLEIARHTVPGPWGSIYRWVKPDRIVPLANVHEVSERLDSHGQIDTPLDLDSVHQAAKKMQTQGVKTVAVCLLHSYLYPDHERQIRAILQQHNPNWFISLSSDIMPEFREYERTSTTAMNAVLAPLVGQYFNEFAEQATTAVGANTALFIMRSAGGVVLPSEAAERPLRTALSGPAGGVVGAGRLAYNAGFDKAITFDMGGTSTDVSAVIAGQPYLTTDGSLGIYPMKTPTIDIVTIGAGGGSLITIGQGKRILVGPQSAGAVPGAACYGKGGTLAAVTDANLVLGRIPTALVGGDFELDRALAMEALSLEAAKINLNAEELAFTALEIVSNNMAGAVRQILIKRGIDPAEFTLVAFGGAGPVQAARVAQILGIPRVMVPLHPGLGSCVGLITADIRMDRSKTLLCDEPEFDVEIFENGFKKLEQLLAKDTEEYDGTRFEFERSVDMRYRGMGTELNVPAPPGGNAASWVSRLLAAYHELHDSMFNFSYNNTHEVQSFALRVTAVGKRGIVIPGHDFSRVMAAPVPLSERRSLFALGGDPVTVPVYNRTDLPQGWTKEGPLFVDQYDTSTVVLPGNNVSVDALGNLLITTVNSGGSDGY